MAKDYTALAKAVVKAVGGPGNIESVSNCMTRLRFILKDDTIPNADEIKAIEGVAGVMNQGGQYQIVIGTHVTNVLPFVKKELSGANGQASASTDDQKAAGREKAESMRVIKKDSAVNKFLKMIQGCLMPLIGPMCGVGILKGILTLLTTVGIMQSTDGTYIVLYSAADAIMLFLPVFVAYSASKVFDATPPLMMAIAAAMISPALISYVGAEEALTFLRIPVQAINYQSSFFPAIAACYLGAKVEKLSKKYLPEVLHLMFVPLIVLVVTVPVALIVIGPIITAASNVIANSFVALTGLSPVFAGILVGALWQLVVLTGLHGAMIPIIINNVITLGADPINGVMTMTVFAVTGVALGYGLRVKDANRKAMALGNVLSGICGVTEPIIYTIALPNFKEFICAMIGGAVAGGILGVFDVQFYTFAGSGIFALPGMINPNGSMTSLIVACVGAVIAFVLSAVLSYIVTKPNE